MSKAMTSLERAAGGDEPLRPGQGPQEQIPGVVALCVVGGPLDVGLVTERQDEHQHRDDAGTGRGTCASHNRGHAGGYPHMCVRKHSVMSTRGAAPRGGSGSR